MVIIFIYLHPALLRIELAHPYTVAHLVKVELLGLIAGKVYYIKPADSGTLLAVGLEHTWRTVEEPLEALYEYGTQRPSAQVAGHRFMALKNGVIVGYQGEEGRKRVLGRYEG